MVENEEDGKVESSELNKTISENDRYAEETRPKMLTIKRATKHVADCPTAMVEPISVFLYLLFFTIGRQLPRYDWLVCLKKVQYFARK